MRGLRRLLAMGIVLTFRSMPVALLAFIGAGVAASLAAIDIVEADKNGEQP